MCIWTIRARERERAVRILGCWLPVKSPWLNAIEPQWIHGKRAIVEPTRKLTSAEVHERVCQHFGCARLFNVSVLNLP